MSTTWKSSLSAIDRYEVIQKIQSKSGMPMNEATSLEQDAYANSFSLQEYHSACDAAAAPPTPPEHGEATNIPDDHHGGPDQEGTGLKIGTYTNCHPIATGVTSEVFRSGTTALKVIITHRQDMEPHNPQREVRILDILHGGPSIIELQGTFRDQEQRMVLVFPYMAHTLADLIEGSTEGLGVVPVRHILADILHGLEHIHSQGIVHRDIKPSAILLPSPAGPAVLSDFGTAWHPTLSTSTEAPDDKILDIGTGTYRAPEVLFGDKSYGPPVDMWGLGVVLAETLGTPLFESRPVHEDGNQLGLILSIFKKLGTPTPETWPEAKTFKVTPFDLWTVFPKRPWEEILPSMDPDFRDLVAALVHYDGQRATAEHALQFKCLK